MEIVIASGKGGTGKTTLTSSLIYLLWDEKKLISVDADAEAPNLHLLLGINLTSVEEVFSSKIAEIDYRKCKRCNICVENCVFRAMAEGPVVKEHLCEGCGACKASCPFDAITLKEVPSGEILISEEGKYSPFISARTYPGRPNTGKIVFEEKRIARELIRKGMGDNILVDSAAGIGCQVIASLSGSDRAILVTEPTKASLEDLKRIHSVVEHFGIPSYLVINKSGMTSFDGIEKFSKENGLEKIGEIPYSTEVLKAISIGVPVVKSFPESEASREISRIAEIISDWLD